MTSYRPDIDGLRAVAVDSLSQTLILYDALRSEFRRVRLRRRPDCPLCSRVSPREKAVS